jgi:hypothetical protein
MELPLLPLILTPAICLSAIFIGLYYYKAVGTFLVSVLFPVSGVALYKSLRRYQARLDGIDANHNAQQSPYAQQTRSSQPQRIDVAAAIAAADRAGGD